MPKPAAKKSAQKSAAVVGRPFRRGGDPRQGRGPAKGAPNAGRPPNEHVEFCRRLISDPAAEAEALAVLTDRSHGAFAAMWKAVAERAYGKPVQPLSGDPTAPLVVRVIREGA